MSYFRLFQGKIESVKNYQQVPVTGGTSCNTLMFLPQMGVSCKNTKTAKKKKRQIVKVMDIAIKYYHLYSTIVQEF